MLEPGLKESRHLLQREDSFELSYQYQHDRDHTTLHTLITTYTLGAANFLLVHP